MVAELVKTGFETTVLTRSGSNRSDVPPGVKVCEVDYTSQESLTKALQGIDAVVCTVGIAGISSQTVLIDAAIAAGVKHYIPADYSVATTQPESDGLAMYAGVKQIQNYLRQRSAEIDWTVICTGAFVEYMLEYPFVLDFDNREALLVNGGDFKCSASSTTSIAKAIAGVLRQPDRVKNREVFVHDTVLTQNHVLALAKKHTPAPYEWTVTNRTPGDKVMDGQGEMRVMGIHAADAFFGGKFHTFYEKNDNEWFGVEMKSDADLEESVKAKIQRCSWGK